MLTTHIYGEVYPNHRLAIRKTLKVHGTFNKSKTRFTTGRRNQTDILGKQIVPNEDEVQEIFFG